MDGADGPTDAPGSGSGEQAPGGSGHGGRRSLRDLERQRSRELQRRFDRDRGYRRAILAGIAVSVAVHLVILFVLSGQLKLPRVTYREAPPTPVTMEGLELVQVEIPETQPAPDRPEEPAERQPEPEQPDEEETEDPEAGQPAPVPSEDAEGETEEGLTNAERLSPKEGDTRVWREFWDEDLRGRYLGGSARADSAIRAIVGKYLDSLRLSEEAYRNARDWTVGEGEERWGVSPEGIHLGDITIPVPVGQLFQPTGPRRRELERELRELREIQRQEQLSDVQKTREERIEEMRERSRGEAGEGESEADSTDTGGGGPR